MLLLHGTDLHIHPMNFSRISTHCLGKLDSENIEHFLMRDLNCDVQSKDDVNVKALLNITDIYGLEQLPELTYYKYFN